MISVLQTRIMIFMILKVCLLLILLFLIIYIPLLVYVKQHLTSSSKDSTDAALVLGAKSYIKGKYNPCLVARVEESVELYRKGNVSTLLFSGGNDLEDGRNEAETMKKIATSSGVSEHSILLEKRSTSTYENILYAQQILSEHNLSTVTVVTDPFHMGRAELVSKSLHLQAQYQVVTNTPCWKSSTYVSKSFLLEPFIIGYYVLRGYIHLSAFSG